MRDSSEVPLKQEEIKSVEELVQEKYRNVEIAVQNNIPEYGLIMRTCRDPIHAYEECLSKNWTKPTPATCQRERVRKEDCVNKIACPELFQAYALCMSGDKRTCNSYKKALGHCVGDLAFKVHLATKNELARLKSLETGSNAKF